MIDISTVCRAIAERRVLAFTYKGKRRMAEPYILGEDDDGQLTLSAWQRSGGSGPGFRNFAVPAMAEAIVTEDKFPRNRPEYNPRDRLFARVICRV